MPGRKTAQAGLLDDRPGVRMATDPSATSDELLPNDHPGSEIQVRTLLLGERLDTRALRLVEETARLLPMTVRVGGGWVVLFRYGVIVSFGLSQPAERALLVSLAPAVSEALPAPECEVVQIQVNRAGEETVDAAGTIVLQQPSLDRLRAIAEILARNALLSHHEASIAQLFDRIEPLAIALRRDGRIGWRDRDLLRQIGDVLFTQHKMVGRAEAMEKPELLWEYPELERLYARLEAEYELRDRARALDAKLDLLSRSCETLIGLVQARRSLRVEWYVVLLIVAELCLSIFALLQAG
ncbi:RMD1 family protein [Inquilinus sp. OTU3971]|uniref:RMD1 family protein n=1 Tax=Inquilinus sp. OTU3971 TaxID=3043855 RepID=UPI00313BCD18